MLATCQGWLLTTQIELDESIFSQDLWMALDRTRYMQSSKTFVMVDRPFWKDIDPATGRPVMGMTLTDRLTRGTYLFDNGPGRPAATGRGADVLIHLEPQDRVRPGEEVAEPGRERARWRKR